ncbi:MAG: hypothetical protein HRT74_07195 [Flavobacteriales bacterium]|nr:hypothetical protein [Flavobacteriales bacterium]
MENSVCFLLSRCFSEDAKHLGTNEAVPVSKILETQNPLGDGSLVVVFLHPLHLWRVSNIHSDV